MTDDLKPAISYQRGILTEALDYPCEGVMRLTIRQPEGNRFCLMMNRDSYNELVRNDFERFLFKEVTVEVDYTDIKEYTFGAKKEMYAMVTKLELGWNTKNLAFMGIRRLGPEYLMVFCQRIQPVVYIRKGQFDPVYDFLMCLKYLERVDVTLDYTTDFNGMRCIKEIVKSDT